MSARAPAIVEPWSGYAVGSDIEHFQAFCSTYCRQAVDDWAGEPLVLEPWQWMMMGEAMAHGPDGRPIWRRVAFILPRKNGKTTLMGAYALYVLLNHGGSPEIMLAARTDKQAGRLYESCEMMVRQDDMLTELVQMKPYKGEMFRRDGMGSLRKFSAESGALDGWNPSLVVADELHAWETPTEKKTFGAMVSGFGARRSPQFFTITTPGDPATRSDSILGQLLDNAIDRGQVEQRPGLQIARHTEARTLVYNYVSPTRDLADTASLKLANPASWITEQALKEMSEASDLTLSQKLRYHAGIWAADEDDFVSEVTWDAGCDPEACEEAFRKGSTVALGMDGSRTYDTTACATAAALPDGRIAVRVHVLSCRKDAPHHEFCEGSKIDFSSFENHIKGQFENHYVSSGGYDPRYLQRSAELLEDELGVDQLAPVEPQSTLMRDALATFYRLVSEGLIVHDGDPVLKAHVTAAKADQDERGWVVRKRTQARPIDALIAACIAVWRAEIDSQLDAPWAMTL